MKARTQVVLKRLGLWLAVAIVLVLGVWRLWPKSGAQKPVVTATTTIATSNPQTAEKLSMVKLILAELGNSSNEVLIKITIVLGITVGLIGFMAISFWLHRKRKTGATISVTAGPSLWSRGYGYSRKYPAITIALAGLLVLAIFLFFPAWATAWGNQGEHRWWYVMFSVGGLLALALIMRRWGVWLLAILLAMVLIGYPFQTEIKVWYQDVQLRAEAEAARTKMTAEIVSPRVILAPVGEWSETIRLPANVWWRLTPEGKIRVRTLSGKTWEDKPGEMITIPRLDPNGRDPADRTFQIQSLEAVPVTVSIDWNPK